MIPLVEYAPIIDGLNVPFGTRVRVKSSGSVGTLVGFEKAFVYQCRIVLDKFPADQDGHPDNWYFHGSELELTNG